MELCAGSLMVRTLPTPLQPQVTAPLDFLRWARALLSSSIHPRVVLFATRQSLGSVSLWRHVRSLSSRPVACGLSMSLPKVGY